MQHHTHHCYHQHRLTSSRLSIKVRVPVFLFWAPICIFVKNTIVISLCEVFTFCWCVTTFHAFIFPMDKHTCCHAHKMCVVDVPLVPNISADSQYRRGGPSFGSPICCSWGCRVKVFLIPGQLFPHLMQLCQLRAFQQT